MTRRTRTILWRVGGFVAILVAIGAAIVGIGFHVFYPTPPAPSGPLPRDLASAQRQDLAYFRHDFDLDRAYSDVATLNPRTLIVDLRFNQRGNFTKAASLMKHVTSLAPSIEHARAALSRCASTRWRTTAAARAATPRACSSDRAR
jgi:hypothetical protein